ncbi:MAG: hypothetical protein H6598_03025 [Flavobacteriales bacterium]|nr:hypothetical protein [Flavobacteriales bacterium]
MRILFVLLFSLWLPSVFGQEMIDRIDPTVIVNHKITSCTEWINNEERLTLHYNDQGLPMYYLFPADVLDTNQKLVTGNYGKKEFRYDEHKNLTESVVSFYEPYSDSTTMLTMVNYHYENDLLIKKEYYDNPNSSPIVTNYFYDDKLLTKEIKTRPDSALIVVTGEKFKTETVHYQYNASKKLSSISNYRENHLIDSISIEYHQDTVSYTTIVQGEITSTIKKVYNAKGQEIERIYPESKIVRWKYNNVQLLESIEYHYLTNNTTRMTTFSYQYK